MASKKQPATMSGKTPAKKVDGHEIQQPHVIDEAQDREVTLRNDEAIRDAPEPPAETADKG